MSNNGQLNNDQAIKQLTAAWNQTHAQEIDTWNQQMQADLAEQGELARLAKVEEGRLQAEDKCLRKNRRENKKRSNPR